MDATSFYAHYIHASAKELAGDAAVLQNMVEQCPWFSLGHFLVFKSLCGLGGEQYVSQASKVAPYMFSRAQLARLLEQKPEETVAPTQETPPKEEDFFVLDTEEMAATPAPNPTSAYSPASTNMDPMRVFELDAPPQRIIQAGADYFGKTDLETVSLDASEPVDKFIEDHPRFTQFLKRPGEQVDVEDQDNSPIFGDDDFVTETLARIYTEQGYYKLALTCYNKLILLYPKKSAYFAALVEEIKQKTNN